MILSFLATHSLYLVDPSGAVLTVAGTGKYGFADGTAAAAEFNDIRSVVVIERERFAYACDCSNNRIRRITLPPQLFLILKPGDSSSVSLVDVKSTASLERSRIEMELKLVWDEITRISRHQRTVIEIGAAGPNATSINGTDCMLRNAIF